MPNHVANAIDIKESVSKIREILNTVKGKTEEDKERLFSFESIIPMPSDISRGNLNYGDQKKSNGRNWYDWSIDNWRTKWNAYDVEIFHNIPPQSVEFIKEDFIVYLRIKFTTAWSTPDPIIKKFSEMFPDVLITHTCVEEDNQQFGIWEILNGEEVSSKINLESAKRKLKKLPKALEGVNPLT